jgi:hypothetical protein
MATSTNGMAEALNCMATALICEEKHGQWFAAHSAGKAMSSKGKAELRAAEQRQGNAKPSVAKAVIRFA